MYIAIDGDDSGRKIALCYINNDEAKLREISRSLEAAASSISSMLSANDFRVIFCAADGVTAASDSASVDFDGLFEKIRCLAPTGFTFSAGVGATLHEAYVALLNAKCLGKNRLSRFDEIIR
ncbi:mCpol domain-containing protein [Rhodopseudomonas palustris]|uniref:mCpol domain-containing protein n=1 Tax=Rhodopseudomonas palustris TaxID=1076 RepID=UPI0021F34A02|nr:mCpol domain-containing protein [Rhodopseudomonas palustris]UYO55180.1 mCpol domain-containing protein [Rhodopseudomonas palustris]